jgi:hypothetical protein
MKRSLKIVLYIVPNLKKVSIFETKLFGMAPFFSVYEAQTKQILNHIYEEKKISVTIA